MATSRSLKCFRHELGRLTQQDIDSSCVTALQGMEHGTPSHTRHLVMRTSVLRPCLDRRVPAELPDVPDAAVDLPADGRHVPTFGQTSVLLTLAQRWQIGLPQSTVLALVTMRATRKFHRRLRAMRRVKQKSTQTFLT